MALDRLEAALVRLAEAQARTEERVGRLEDRVGKVEERLSGVEGRVGRLEDRMDRVEAALQRLAEAQARTEERVEALAEAQARTEARLEALAEAQARTEAAVQALAQQVGRLSETIGFTLEDLAREVSPPYLAQHYGIHVPELERRFLRLDDREIEVDFYGEGHRDGEAVVVLGEVKSRIFGRDVEAFARQVTQLAPFLPARPVPVLFGFVIHPSAKEAAGRLGAVVISSSGRVP